MNRNRVRTAHTLRRDWRFHAGYGLLQSDQTRLAADKRRHFLHSATVLIGEDIRGVFVAAGFVGNKVTGHGARSGRTWNGYAVCAAVVFAGGDCHFFSKIAGGTIAHVVNGLASIALRHGKAQIAVNNVSLAVFAAGLGIDFAAGRIGTFKNRRGGNRSCQSEQ